jgi:hypothetical protein
MCTLSLRKYLNQAQSVFTRWVNEKENSAVAMFNQDIFT